MAAALIAVIMGIMASVFSGGVSVWRRGEDETQQYQTLRFLRYRLGLDLRNAVPYPPIPMEGEEDKIRWVLAERPRKGEGQTLAEVRYEVEATGKGQRLTRTVRALLADEEKKEQLLEEIPHIQFFYAYKGEGGKLDWGETWKVSSENSGVPRWIKVEILLKEGDSPWSQIFSLPRGSVGEESREETP